MTRPTPNGALYLKDFARLRRVRRRRRFVLLVRRAPLRLDAEPTATNRQMWAHVGLVAGVVVLGLLVMLLRAG